MITQKTQSEAYAQYESFQRRTQRTIERNRAPILATYTVIQQELQGGADAESIEAMNEALQGISSADRQRAFGVATEAVKAGLVGDPGVVEKVAGNVYKMLGRGVGGRVNDAALLADDLRIEAEREGIASGTAMVDANGRVVLLLPGEVLAGEGLHYPIGEEKAALLKEYDRKLNNNQISREFKNIFQSQIDPYKPVLPQGWLRTLEMGGYQFGEQLPTMLLSAAPGGQLLMTGAIGSQYYNQLKVENPGMNTGAAIALSMGAARIEAVFEGLQFSAMAGKGVLAKKMLTNLRNGGVVTFGAQLGVNLLEQNAEEGIQDLSTTLIFTIASQLRPDMEDKEIAKELGDLINQRADVAAMLVFPAIIGAGFGTWRHLKDPDRQVFNSQKMTQDGDLCGLAAEDLGGNRSGREGCALSPSMGRAHTEGQSCGH